VITVDDPFATTANLDDKFTKSISSGMTKLMTVTKAVSSMSEKLEQLELRNQDRMNEMERILEDGLKSMEKRLSLINGSLERLLEYGGSK
jgi:hypothetical protein